MSFIGNARVIGSPVGPMIGHRYACNQIFGEQLAVEIDRHAAVTLLDRELRSRDVAADETCDDNGEQESNDGARRRWHGAEFLGER
jgi:hypothetical protein